MNNNEEDVFDVLGLLKVLWSKALIIILTGLVFAIAVFGWTFVFVSPKYEATASLYVNNSSFSVGSTSISVSTGQLSASSSLVNTYIYILQSRTTLEDVIEKADLNYDYGQLSLMIKTSQVPDTAAFNVTVVSKSPTEAELIANTIAEVLPQRISEIVDGTSARIVDFAIVPAHRSSPSYTINAVIGFLAGALLVAGLITVRFLIDERNDRAIHSAEELRELYPDISVLALIPDMRLASKKGYYYSSYYGKSGKGD